VSALDFHYVARSALFDVSLVPSATELTAEVVQYEVSVSLDLVGANGWGTYDKTRPWPPDIELSRSRSNSIRAGFDSSRTTVVTGTAWAVPAAAEELADLFLRANAEHHVAGISAGIGSNRRRKCFKFNWLWLLGDCRPGAPRIKHEQ
jgi:hypothetical protein